MRDRPLVLAIAVTSLAAIVPIIRAFFRIDIGYSEGWNVYNAAALTDHHALYPVKYR